MVQLFLLFQAAQATVVGVVRGGEARVPLAGAVVALTDLDRITTTDASGRYILRNVPPGPQHISVRFIGHAPQRLHALVPPSGHLEINVSLRAEPPGKLFAIASLLPLLQTLDQVPPAEVDGSLFRAWQRLDRLVQLRPRLQSLGADTVEVAQDAQALLSGGTTERTLALSTRFSPLAGSQLANLGGFLARPLRELDYYGGIYAGVHAAANGPAAGSSLRNSTDR